MNASHFYSDQEVYSALKKYFGFDHFRPLQKEVVDTVLAGSDCVAVLPTGGGKSLCFQLPGLLLPGLTLVISPLISLMTDQVHHLREKNISAAAFNSSLTLSEQKDVEHQVRFGNYKFLYVSPEKLSTASFVKFARTLDISLVVIDEAHCISEWGHQFRPEYRKISAFISVLPERPVLAAFTASATPRTASDISTQLQLRTPKVFRQSVLRSNLYLQVIDCPSTTLQYLILMRLLRAHSDQPTLIYCATRRQTEETAEMLSKIGVASHAYHAGLSSQERGKVQQAFLMGEYQLICATTAFGMGVDKADIRLVIHLNLPVSVEGYYQEVGRAGRNGNSSWCYLLALPNDFQLQLEIIERGYPPLEAARVTLQKINSYSMSQVVHFQTLTENLMIHQQEHHLYKLLVYGEEKKWWKANWSERTLRVLKPISEVTKTFHVSVLQYQRQLNKLVQMAVYCKKERCRMRQLLLYFEPSDQRLQWINFRCRQCDVCAPSSKTLPTTQEQKDFHRFTLLTYKKRSFDTPLRLLTLQLLAVHQNTVHTPSLPGWGMGWQKSWGKLTAASQTKSVSTKLYRKLEI